MQFPFENGLFPYMWENIYVHAALRAMLAKPADISSLASGSTSREQVQWSPSLSQFSTTITEEHVDILKTSLGGECYVQTLEALHIREQKPQINTKDEYKSRELMIKL